MAWARISDDFLDHQKVAELTVDIEGLAAMGLWTLALCWVRADRRRRGVVPMGIAIRLSAGNGKQLASRLVQVGLWDEVEGGFYFHDYDDVYTPGDLSEKRAEAGRSGGKASGRTRAARAATQVSDDTRPEPKQVASSRDGANRTVGRGQPPSLFDDDDPLTAGSAASTDRSNDEANGKQTASNGEAKRPEASHARAGTTTHYPEGSNEPSSLPPQPRTDRGTRLAEDWQPDGELTVWAKREYPNVNLAEETERFRNYWLSKTGRDAAKRSWPRTFKNWIMEANSRLTRFPGNGGAYKGRGESVAPKPIPADERCSKHPSFRATSCGPCRSDRLVAGSRG